MMSSLTGDWSELPGELLNLILDRLTLFRDFVRFGAVCRSWNSAQTNSRCLFGMLRSRIPLLLILSSSESLCFYSPTEQKSYDFYLPEISSRGLIGVSCSGLLFIVDEFADLHAWNPFTGANIRLPPTTTLPFSDITCDPSSGEVTGYKFTYLNGYGSPDSLHCDLHSEHGSRFMRDRYFHKAVLDPSSNTVIIVFGAYYEQIAYARPGDTSWILLEPFYWVEEVVFHKGLLHAVDILGQLVAFDLRPPSVSSTAYCNDKLPVGRHCAATSMHLVESPNGTDLFLILRVVYALIKESSISEEESYDIFRLDDDDVGDEDQRDPKHLTRKTSFQVFKLDDEGRWREVEDAGDIAFFVGFKRSISLSSQEFPQLRRNCIYYVNDYDEVQHRWNCNYYTNEFSNTNYDYYMDEYAKSYYNKQDTCASVGIFDLGNGTSQHINPSADFLQIKGKKPISWFTSVGH